MEENQGKEVKLLGMWASVFAKRVEMALKLKGIPYEYVEEDIVNKSEQLLSYNPIHKKVPVLIHQGKPISESLIILEYIDEKWKNLPLLLPQDPVERSKVRFWANYLEIQVFARLQRIQRQAGEEQMNAAEDLYQKLKVFEESVKEQFSHGNLFYNGLIPGFLDIVLWSYLGLHEPAEEAYGVKLVDPNRNPLILKWVTSLNDHPVTKEIAPSREGFATLLKQLRSKTLQTVKA